MPLCFTTQILKDFFRARIEKNSLRQTRAADNDNEILPLVSSVAIAYIISTFRVCLEPEHYAKLFSSLILKSEPEEQTCTSFQRILDQFPCEQWL